MSCEFPGIVSDVLIDKPDLIPTSPFVEYWTVNARLVEEQFDLWGFACMSFASLVTFRTSLEFNLIFWVSFFFCFSGLLL